MAYLCAMTLFGQGIETFLNVSLTASYSDGEFDGNDGIKWNYVQCRNVTSATLTTGGLEKTSLHAILLKDESSIEGFEIYPNPVKSGGFSISSSSSSNKRVQLYIVLGKQVFNKIVKRNE